VENLNISYFEAFFQWREEPNDWQFVREELRSLGLSRQKASYLHNIAEAFDKNRFLEKYKNTESLDRLSSDEIVRLFVDIKGVGEWTVQMYLIFALGRLDVLASNDLGVRKGVMKLYELKEMPTPKQVKNLAGRGIHV
jgi:DNA-3-methyladenine glycosylase II